MTPVTTDPLDWDALIARVRGGHGSDARRQVGTWAMAQVRKALGESWPRRRLARYGSLPAFARDPASDAFAYAELVETGLRLHSLDGTARLPTVVKHWSSQLEDISMRHAWIQLEVAALARFQGAAVEFETPVRLPATERPADVVLAAEDAQLVAECFCIYSDQNRALKSSPDHPECRRAGRCRAVFQELPGWRVFPGHGVVGGRKEGCAGPPAEVAGTPFGSAVNLATPGLSAQVRGPMRR